MVRTSVRTAALAVGIVAGIVALLGVPRPAHSTLTRARTLEQLAIDADSVIRGRVVAQEVVRDGETDRVRTVSTVAVDEALAGDDAPGSTVRVSQPGGVLGDVTVRVSGTAPLAVGQDVLLFLRGRGDQVRAPVGMAQGVWFVERGADGIARVSAERPAAPKRPTGAPEAPRYDGVAARVRGAAATR